MSLNSVRPHHVSEKEKVPSEVGIYKEEEPPAARVRREGTIEPAAQGAPKRGLLAPAVGAIAKWGGKAESVQAFYRHPKITRRSDGATKRAALCDEGNGRGEQSLKEALQPRQEKGKRH